MSEDEVIEETEVEESLSIQDLMVNVQTELVAPKERWNKFGKYSYRSCEDILNALKPFADLYGFYVVITDDIVEVGGRVYVKATVRLNYDNDSVSVTAFAREPADRKGMDQSQITGCASSYARKYALNGLFAIDDVVDDDGEYEKMDDAAMDYERIDLAYKAFKEVIDADVDVMDWERVQVGYNRLTNDERQEVVRRFGKDKPEGCKRGYKSILKELVKMKPEEVGEKHE